MVIITITRTHLLKQCFHLQTNITPEPTPEPVPLYIKVDDNINTNLYYVNFKLNFVEKNTDENYKRYDFADVMNIGNKSYQNKPEQYQNKWLRRIDFYNVWIGNL